MTTVVKKITAKTVMGNIKQIIREQNNADGKPLADGDSLALFDVIGQVMGHQTGESDFGPWVKLKGRFRATNRLTSEVFNSSTALLPEEITDPVLAALQLDGAQAVDMAFTVSLKIDDASATGYVYTVASLLDMAADDPLEQLAARVQQALPAPSNGGKGKSKAA